MENNNNSDRCSKKYLKYSDEEYKEKYNARRKKGKEIFEKLKEMDFSTKKDREAAGFLAGTVGSSMARKKGLTQFRGVYDNDMRYSTPFFSILKNSCFQKPTEEFAYPMNPGGYTYPTITSENLFQGLNNDGIGNYYGHCLVKRPYAIKRFLIGESTHEQAIEKYGKDRVLFARGTEAAAMISSQFINGRPPIQLLYLLAGRVEDGEISEPEARQHPNFPNIERLVLECDKQQGIITNLIFKMFSHLVQNGEIQIPQLNLSKEQSSNFYDTIEKVANLYKGDWASAWTPFTSFDEMKYSVTNTSKDFKFNKKIDAGVQWYGKNVRELQPLVEMFDDKMEYEG